jgi:hypothetical protein
VGRVLVGSKGDGQPASRVAECLLPVASGELFLDTPCHDVDVVVGGGESPRVPARSRMSGPKRSPQVMPPLPTEACRLRNARTRPSAASGVGVRGVDVLNGPQPAVDEVRHHRHVVCAGSDVIGHLLVDQTGSCRCPATASVLGDALGIAGGPVFHRYPLLVPSGVISGSMAMGVGATGG